MSIDVTYTRTDKVLTVPTKNGRRRTLRAHEIIDLIEVENDETEVVYRANQRIIVPIAFDELLEYWTTADDDPRQ